MKVVKSNSPVIKDKKLKNHNMKRVNNKRNQIKGKISKSESNRIRVLDVNKNLKLQSNRILLSVMIVIKTKKITRLKIKSCKINIKIS